jgi:hypothetical protein
MAVRKTCEFAVLAMTVARAARAVGQKAWHAVRTIRGFSQ